MSSEIVFIESPLQVKSALKVISNSRHSLIVCRLNGNAQNDFRIKSYLRGTDVQYRCIVARPGGFFGLIRIILLSLYVRLSRAFRFKKTTIFIGDYRSLWMRICSCIFTLKYMNVLDDGMATIHVVAKLDKDPIGWRNLSRLLSPPLYFHTEFNIKAERVGVITLPAERVDDERKVNNTIAYFIGCPLVEKGIIAEQDYKQLMFDIEKYFRHKNSAIHKIIYIPHRAEKEKYYSSIFDGCDIFSVELLDEDIELHMNRLKELPSCIASFYSTALFMLRESNTDVKSFKIPHGFVLEGFSKNIDQVYDFYNLLDGVEVVGL